MQQLTSDARLDAVMARLDRLERHVERIQPMPVGEAADEPWPWTHLARNLKSWRHQPYIKGRNLTVRQLVGAVKANGLTAETAAADLGLEVDAVREALDYAERHPELLSFEAAYERLILEQEGYGRGPQAVPG